jgi:hypothetical protein
MTALIRRGIDQSLAIRFMRLARVKLIEKDQPLLNRGISLM